ncbi:MAG: GDSL-type esterase/lipase family protein [Chitinophagaceae bacterium]
MIRLFLLINLAICYNSLFAQNTKWDSSYLSTYYGQKVTLFNFLPDTKNEIIFLGNSITDIGEWAEIWQDKHVKNRGISGDNTFGVLARLDEVVASLPKKIFIMIGINDIAKNIPDSVILTNYQKIIQQIQTKSSKTKIIVQSILPTNNAFTQFINHQNKTNHILAVNLQLQKICAEKSIDFVNLYPLFLDEEGKLSKTYTNDGLHLNGNGYMLWKKTLQQLKLMP